MPAVTPPRAALLLALCWILAGCGVPVDREPRDLDRPRVGSGSEAAAPHGFGQALERLYFVRDGALVRVIRRLPAAPAPQRQLDDLLAGPSAEERADGMISALTTMRVTGMSVADRRATVTIGERSNQGARSDEVLAFGQIVCTLTSQGADVGTVSFVSGGQLLRVPRADGSLATGPLTIADYAGLLET
jgi:Sporulation and spore germination